jgi:hypothetical protein
MDKAFRDAIAAGYTQWLGQDVVRGILGTLFGGKG